MVFLHLRLPVSVPLFFLFLQLEQIFVLFSALLAFLFDCELHLVDFLLLLALRVLFVDLSLLVKQLFLLQELLDFIFNSDAVFLGQQDNLGVGDLRDHGAAFYLLPVNDLENTN